MEKRVSSKPWRLRIDTGAAIFLAILAGWLIDISNRAADEAVRLYGYNVDSGALTYIAAIIYVLPAAVLFGLAALSLFRGWRLGKFLHWLAIAWLVALPLWDFLRVL